MITAFPLKWPEGYARTPAEQRRRSQFRQTIATARAFLQEEVRRLEGSNLVISSNQPLKQNGELRGDSQRFTSTDYGVAVYFDWKGRSYTMCCDAYRQLWENLYAIARTIAALRQIDRDGVSDFLERAFTGFPALPAAGESTAFDAWSILGIAPTRDVDTIRAAWREKSKVAHPDAPGGSPQAWDELQEALKQATQQAPTIKP